PIDDQPGWVREREEADALLAFARAEGHDEVLVLARHEQRRAQPGQEIPPGSAHAVREEPRVDGDRLAPVARDLGGAAPVRRVAGPHTGARAVAGRIHDPPSPARRTRPAPRYILIAE